MLSSVLKRKKKDFLIYINDLWKQYGEVRYDDFNKKIGKSDQSTIKFLSLITEKMYGERLAAQVDTETNIITGWQFYIKENE
jgi:hypothetical protein